MFNSQVEQFNLFFEQAKEAQKLLKEHVEKVFSSPFNMVNENMENLFEVSYEWVNKPSNVQNNSMKSIDLMKTMFDRTLNNTMDVANHGVNTANSIMKLYASQSKQKR